jgi:hypothetical protein
MNNFILEAKVPAAVIIKKISARRKNISGLPKGEKCIE